jgi:hypothetical protein
MKWSRVTDFWQQWNSIVHILSTDVWQLLLADIFWRMNYSLFRKCSPSNKKMNLDRK